MDLLKRVFANVVQTIVPDSFINRNRPRKRSAENFEPELTDDEETLDTFHLNRKRMRPSFESGPSTSTSIRVLFSKAPPAHWRDERKLPLQPSQNVPTPTDGLDDDIVFVGRRGSEQLSSPKATICLPSSFKKIGNFLGQTGQKKEMKSKNRYQRTPIFERFKRHGLRKLAVSTRADTVRLDERNEYMRMICDLRNGTNSFMASLKNFSASSHKPGHAPLVQSKTSVPELIAKQKNWFNVPNVAYNGIHEKVTILNLRASNYTNGEIEPATVKSPTVNRKIETIDISQDQDSSGEDSGSSSRGSDIVNVTPAKINFRTPSSSTSKTSSKFDALENQIKDVLNNSLGTFDDPIELEDDDKNVSGMENKSVYDDDEDVQIFTPSILKSQPINSLALDLKASPYADNRWLQEHKTSRDVSRLERELQLKREQKKLEILQNESTIDDDLAQGIRRNLKLTNIIVLEEKEKVKLPEIDESMFAVIHRARSPGRSLNDVIANTPNNIQLTRSDIKSLGPMQWLNDNVINSYLDMIALRSKSVDKWPAVYVFTTFFYPKYLNEGYSNILKRWTRKVDIFSYKLLIFPIHLGIHWCLATADLRSKTIKYYDSLGGKNFQCVKALLQYLGKEHQERKKTSLMETEWKTEIVEDIPQQKNGSDCGMFACKFAEYLSRDAELSFKQEDMNYYRERMIYEIITQDLLYP